MTRRINDLWQAHKARRVLPLRQPLPLSRMMDPAYRVGEGERFVILAPYRANKHQNREEQKARFTECLPRLFDTVGLRGKYAILIVEQPEDGMKFNKGALMNAGVDFANKTPGGDITAFHFHDVDLVPACDSLAQVYAYKPRPGEVIHLGALWQEKYQYPGFFGGIQTFHPADYAKINGYPNHFWGWGGDDDALLNRLGRVGIQTVCDPRTENSSFRFTEMSHSDTDSIDALKQQPAQRKEKMLIDLDFWKRDGLKQIGYEVEADVLLGENMRQVTIRFTRRFLNQMQVLHLADHPWLRWKAGMLRFSRLRARVAMAGGSLKDIWRLFG